MDLRKFKEDVNVKYKNQMFVYLDKQGDKIKKESDKRRDKLKTVSDVEIYKKKIKKAFTAGLKDEIFNEKIISAEKTGTIRKTGYEIEKVVLKTDKGVKITTNAYKPLNIKGKIPAILFLCGHSPEGKALDDYQIVETELARAGFFVLAVDAIGQGERFTYYNIAVHPLL